MTTPCIFISRKRMNEKVTIMNSDQSHTFSKEFKIRSAENRTLGHTRGGTRWLREVNIPCSKMKEYIR